MGEFVILTGENGAAKSTLVKASLGLLKPSKGMIKIAEKNQEGKIKYRLYSSTSCIFQCRFS